MPASIAFAVVSSVSVTISGIRACAAGWYVVPIAAATAASSSVTTTEAFTVITTASATMTPNDANAETSRTRVRS